MKCLSNHRVSEHLQFSRKILGWTSWLFIQAAVWLFHSCIVPPTLHVYYYHITQNLRAEHNFHGFDSNHEINARDILPRVCLYMHAHFKNCTTYLVKCSARPICKKLYRENVALYDRCKWQNFRVIGHNRNIGKRVVNNMVRNHNWQQSYFLCWSDAGSKWPAIAVSLYLGYLRNQSRKAPAAVLAKTHSTLSEPQTKQDQYL